MAGTSARSIRPPAALRAIGRWLRDRPVVIPLLAGGALLIAIGAGPAPDEGAWTGLPPIGALRTVLTVLMLLAALAGLVLLVTVRPIAGQGPRRRLAILPGLLTLLVVAFVLSTFEPGEPTEDTTEPTPPQPEAPAGRGRPEPGFETGDGAALTVILVTALAIVWLLYRRDDRSELDAVGAGDDPTGLGASAGRAARHLLDRSDPRSAVLLAYHDLEATLEGLDLPRRPSETPTEHLDRALRSLSISDPWQAEPLRELAALYGRARYSHHPITADEQRRAGEALDRAHRRLVGSS